MTSPSGSVDDLWLRTEYAPDGTGFIDPEIIAVEQASPIEIEIPELGAQKRLASPSDLTALFVGEVEPWNAEVLRLYETRVKSSGETLLLRLGFRR